MLSKVVPAAAGIRRPCVQTWMESSRIISRIHMPIQGKMSYHDVNGPCVLEEGAIYLMVNSCSQNFGMLPDVGYYHMYIDFYTVPPLLRQEVLKVDFGEDPYLYHMVKAIEALIRNSGNYNAAEGSYEIVKNDHEMEQIRALLELILRHFQARYQVLAIENPKMQLAIKYIEEHYAEPIGNRDLAKLLGVDLRYLMRLFDKHLGISPHSYLMQCRIEHALTFLREGASVHEAAYRCGYRNESAFRTAFTNMMGMSPTKLKKLM